MADRVLLALTSGPEGGPACLLEHDGVAAVTRLVHQLRGQLEGGEVVVVTFSAWADAVRAALPAGTVLREVGSHAEAVRTVAAAAAVPAAAGPDTGLVLAHAHLVANDLAVGRVADAAARGTAAVVMAPGAEGTPVRVARGRIVAAGSAYHELAHPTGTCVRVVRIGAGDRGAAAEALMELAELLAADGPDVGVGAMGHKGFWVDAQGDRAPRPGVEPWDELVALSLVALVRAGIPVAAQGVPAGSVWRHPRTSGELRETLTAIDALDEERQRLAAAVKSDDGFFTTFLVSSYSRYWARWAARRGLTPNQVSSASMALGIVAAGAFATGRWGWTLFGAVVLQLAFTLDCVDGQLARYSRRFSTLGAWLDSVFDRGKEYVVYAGLAVGGIRAGDDTGLWLLAGAALALQTFRHTLDLGYAEQQLADVDAAVRQPLALAGDAGPSFWEAAATEPAANGTPAAATASPAGATPSAPPAARSLPRRVIGLLRRAEHVGVLRWAKRIVVLPIGERFALISVVAVVAGPRAVFLALLVWGGLATLYTAGGRVVRSLA